MARPRTRATAPRRLTPRQLAAEIERLRKELRPKLPDVDPGDLVLILDSVLRPPGTGRLFFLRKSPSGRYVI